ncbi:MAG: NAD(P)/FAD-dependent oxidoreductase [Gammaproteobacteria bacterium]|nr:NAD(P)/FAD-dependent oxidoreductase [Gammaproteobacteria bacterium]
MFDEVDCAVIGAGVIGLAVGRALAQAGRDVIILERNGHIGEETSSRNSEVIHAGLYYATGSLKARLCVDGKQKLYAYCRERNVRHDRCGKLVVAIDESQRTALELIAAQAADNGVDDIELIDSSELERREPAVIGCAALWSPSTGIVDSHALMLALQADIESSGGLVATHAAVTAIDADDDAIRLTVGDAAENSTLSARTVINAGGLGAADLAHACRGIDRYRPPVLRFAKGSYFVFRGASPFRHLVYPLPVDGGLGIHATHDLDGKLRFGPDVEWIDAIDYRVDSGKAVPFANSIRSYWPDIDAASLDPGYAGVRPKLAGPGEPAADFRVDVATGGSRRQLIHLYGFESPGLTASLAIADHVAGVLGEAEAD